MKTWMGRRMSATMEQKQGRTANCNINGIFFSNFPLKTQKEWRIALKNDEIILKNGHLFAIEVCLFLPAVSIRRWSLVPAPGNM